MSFDVSGKVALVSGANRGIGKAITESLLKAGAKKVYAAVRNPNSAADLVKAGEGKVVAIALDLSKPDTITAAAKQAIDVQLVVNNAGVLQVATPFDGNAIDSLKEQMDVNVYGLIRIAQAFAPVLKKNGGGAFVQLNSVASLRNIAGFTTYCASKAASYSVTQGIRDLLREQGTQVLSVHPGPIKTDMGHEAGLDEIAEPPGLVGEGVVRALKAGDFQLYPDTMARDVGAAYQSFADNVVNAELSLA